MLQLCLLMSRASLARGRQSALSVHRVFSLLCRVAGAARKGVAVCTRGALGCLCLVLVTPAWASRTARA